MPHSRSLLPLLALLLGLTVAVGAAEPTVAELEAKLESATGSGRVALLTSLAYEARFASPARAVAYGEEALRLARELGDRKLEGRALVSLSGAYNAAARHEQALHCSRAGLAILETLGSDPDIADATNTLGVIQESLGEYQQAVDLYTRSLEIERRLGNTGKVARELSNLGNAHKSRGEYELAIDCQRQSVAACRAVGDRACEARALNNLGVVYIDLGDSRSALDPLLRSIEIYDNLGHLKAAADPLYNTGNVYFDLGLLDRAQASFERALLVFTEAGDRPGIAGAHLNLGNIAKVGHRDEQAIAEYRQAFEVAEEIDDPALLAMVLDNLGVTLRSAGRAEEALDNHREALALRERIGDQRGQATTWGNLAVVYGELRRYEEATDALDRGFAIAGAIGARSVKKNLFDTLAGVEEGRGRYREALAAYRQYAALKDSLLNETTSRQVTQMQARYEASRKEKEIALLQQEKELERLRASRARLAAGLGLLGLVGVLGAAAFFLRKYLYLLAFWKKRSTVGRYRLRGVIAEGGMGVVYRAADLASGSRELALKVIREEYCDDPVLRRRFIHEAAIVDQLDHPNIVRTFERGEQDGRLYIAMELLEGPTLAQVVARGELLPVAFCLRVAAQLEDALATIHGKGILHRDLKPGNVVLLNGDGGPQVKLLDFGLATSQAVTRMTETGMIVGTIGYLAPERISEQVCTAASDLYALGVILYEALTLRRPFPGETPAEVIRAILDGQAVAASRHRPELPAEVDALVLRLLALDPAERPQHDELRQAIAVLLDRLPQDPATVPIAGPAGSQPDSDTWSTGATLAR